MQNDSLLQLLSAKFPSQIISSRLNLGDAEVVVKREAILDFVGLLKLDAELKFNYLVSVTAVDWLDARPERFEVVYHFLSLALKHRLRVKVNVSESEPVVASLVSLYAGANFMEREVWDMFGIKFSGHPDLRRILTYDEFKGHPLRKDYPVHGKQPRLPLRVPEMRNTALDMVRPNLVKINQRRRDEAKEAPSGNVTAREAKAI